MPNPNTCLTCHYSLGHTAPTSLGRCTVPLPPTTPPTHLDKTRGDYVCALWARKVKAVQTPPERFPTPGWENDTARGSGRTTRQLKEAPRYAYYVCPNTASINYTKRMAISLGRSDLHFTTADMFGTLRGVYMLNIVLDHACMLTATEMENFRILQSRCEEATNP